jgi:cellulose synthase/poly-beta-1,6-N-acetylglucosamine synthase-like glycosyltransferase
VNTLLHLALLAVEWVNVISLLGLIVVALGFLALPLLYIRQRRVWADHAEASVAAPMADPPHVLVQLPVYNEPEVVGGLLECMAALDWPRNRLHVQLLDDSSDETVEIARAKIAELRARGFDVEHVRREHRAGFKAAALAAGLVRSDAPVVAILDADFRPPADWLQVVVPKLMADPTAAFVQSRCELANRDENWLTRAQSLLFDSHYLMEQGVRAQAGFLIQFNGTGAVWRRAAIEAAGGWSSDSLSEDLDLAARAALAGWRGLFLAEPPVPGTAPHDLGHWRAQQRRWSMGFAQNARTLPLQVLKTDWTAAQKVSAEFLLLYQSALPVVPVAILASLVDLACGCPDLAIVGPLWVATAVLAVALAVGMTLPPYLALRRGGAGRYMADLAAVPALVVFLAFANTKAILAGFLGRKDAFHRTPKRAAVLDGDPPAGGDGGWQGDDLGARTRGVRRAR